MNNNNDNIILGSITGHHLILQPREVPIKHIDDEKCCQFDVIVSVGNFMGSSQVTLAISMFQQLYQALNNFTKNPVGEFTFSSIQREFWASIRSDGSGELVAYCILDDCESKYNRLRFKIKFRKEGINQILTSIKKFLLPLGISLADL